MSTENLENSNQYGTLKTQDYLQTLERGLYVIQTFKDQPSLTISESSKLTGLPRPVTRRVLLTLEHLGYVKNINGQFSLTPKILSLGYSYISSNKIWEAATPYLKTLSEKLGESSSLCILDDTDVVYVARVPVEKIMKMSISIGTRIPAHVTSMGKVLLANLSPQKVDNYFGKTTLHSYTKNTCTDEAEIRKNLANIREAGWAISFGELEEGLISIAAPIRDIRGEVVAAINCSTHSGRTTLEVVEQEFLPHLIKTADQISKSIDFEVF